MHVQKLIQLRYDYYYWYLGGKIQPRTALDFARESGSLSVGKLGADRGIFDSGCFLNWPSPIWGPKVLMALKSRKVCQTPMM